MCSVSVISEYYFYQQPLMQTIPYAPVQRPYIPPVQQWDQEAKQLLREVLERLDKLDKRLGDLECHDDSKAALRKELGLEV